MVEKYIGAVILSICMTGCTPPPVGQMTSDDVSEALAYCDSKIHRTLTELKDESGDIDYTMMPRNILSGQTAWNLLKADKTEWCSGFWPGILWYDYEATGDTLIRAEAERFTASLEFLADTPAYDHDLGFLVITSLLNGYRLTGREDYKVKLLACADSLAELYNPKVGTILSWPRHCKDFGGHNTIMDNMINLELLFWASRHGGSEDLRKMAIRHVDTTMDHQFRTDGTCYHVAVYDTLDGHHLYNCTHQGLADSSLWARGQSWAIYGYTMAYRETHDNKYLDFAQKVTDVYLEKLPDDMVPYWDFCDPRIATTYADSLQASPAADGTASRNCPRDASAAAIVASALLELDQYAPHKGYRRVAEQMLATLSSDRYRAGSRCSAFLLHSTGNHPAGTEIDAAIIYADYYYIEALCRLKALLLNATK